MNKTYVSDHIQLCLSQTLFLRGPLEIPNIGSSVNCFKLSNTGYQLYVAKPAKSHSGA